MKKVIVIAAVALSAMFANAASLNWKVVTGVADLNVYIVSALADGGFTSEANISNYLLGTDDNSGVSVKNGRGATLWYGDTGTAIGIDAELEGTQSFYAVVVSADGKGYWTMQGSGEVYTTATEPVQGVIDMSSTVAGAYTEWKTEPIIPDPGDDPVTPAIPEPTTGLLLLIGAAGLALRRKA